MEDEFFLHPIAIEETLDEIKTAVEEMARTLPEERNVRKKLDGWVLNITELQTKATYISNTLFLRLAGIYNSTSMTPIRSSG